MKTLIIGETGHGRVRMVPKAAIVVGIMTSLSFDYDLQMLKCSGPEKKKKNWLHNNHYKNR